MKITTSDVVKINSIRNAEAPINEWQVRFEDKNGNVLPNSEGWFNFSELDQKLKRMAWISVIRTQS